MVEIDGSYGEGGGQILRTSLALSAITGKGFRIYNIRKKRKIPGLLPQHLTAVNAAKKMTDAETKGAELYSSELMFAPKGIKGGVFEFDVAEERRSAGSVTLVYQTVFPIALFADKRCRIVVKGGTHVPMSPLYEYFDEVFLELLKRLFSVNVKRRLIRHGFYPKGGGKVEIEVEPIKKFKLIDEDFTKRRSLKSKRIKICISSLPDHVKEREKRVLKSCIPEPIEIEEIKLNLDPGNYIFLKLEFENTIAGFSSLGMKGKPAEKVAEEVCKAYKSYISKDVLFDSHLADQILLFFSLSQKDTVFTIQEPTKHLLTNAWVIEKFLNVKIKIEKDRVSIYHGKE